MAHNKQTPCKPITAFGSCGAFGPKCLAIKSVCQLVGTWNRYALRLVSVLSSRSHVSLSLHLQSLSLCLVSDVLSLYTLHLLSLADNVSRTLKMLRKECPSLSVLNFQLRRGSYFPKHHALGRSVGIAVEAPPPTDPKETDHTSLDKEQHRSFLDLLNAGGAEMLSAGVYDSEKLVEVCTRMLDSVEALLVESLASESPELCNLACALREAAEKHFKDFVEETLLLRAKDLQERVQVLEATTQLQKHWQAGSEIPANTQEKVAWLKQGVRDYASLLRVWKEEWDPESDESLSVDVLKAAAQLKQQLQAAAKSNTKGLLQSRVEQLENIGRGGQGGASWRASLTKQSPWTDIVKASQHLLSTDFADLLLKTFKIVLQDLLCMPSYVMSSLVKEERTAKACKRFLQHEYRHSGSELKRAL